LETELCKIAPPSIFVQVFGSPWRYHSAYLGAQVIANSHQFDQCCASKTNLEDYIKQVEADVN
jgi:actin-related protein